MQIFIYRINGYVNLNYKSHIPWTKQDLNLFYFNKSFDTQEVCGNVLFFFFHVVCWFGLKGGKWKYIHLWRVGYISLDETESWAAVKVKAEPVKS